MTGREERGKRLTDHLVLWEGRSPLLLNASVKVTAVAVVHCNVPAIRRSGDGRVDEWCWWVLVDGGWWMANGRGVDGW
jgi:hypothetical protein